MVSVSLVLIRTAVAPSFTESFAAIISNHVISIFGGVTPFTLQFIPGHRNASLAYS